MQYQFSIFSPSSAPNTRVIKAKYSLSYLLRIVMEHSCAKWNLKIALGKAIAYLIKRGRWCWPLPGPLPSTPPTLNGALPIIQASILQWCEDVQKNSRDTNPDTVELLNQHSYPMPILFQWLFHLAFCYFQLKVLLIETTFNTVLVKHKYPPPKFILLYKNQIRLNEL